MRRWSRAGLSLVAIAAVTATVAVWVSHDSTTTIRASSTATGDPKKLQAAVKTERSTPIASRQTVWRSLEEVDGAWLEFSWPATTTVDSLTVLASPNPAEAVRSAVLMFDDGSNIMVSSPAGEDIDVTFSRREVTSVRLVVAQGGGSTAVALAGAQVFDSGAGAQAAPDSAEPTVSVSSGLGADALTGTTLPGEGGADQWTAAPGDATPWVEVRWPQPRLISAIQVVGPEQTAHDPANSAASELYGELEFPDSSTVVVSGIDGGSPQTTTVSFTPRMADSVRLRVMPAVDGATVGLRGIRVYADGETPQKPSTPITLPPASPDIAGGCDSSDPPVASRSDSTLSLVCPEPGAAVADTWTLTVAGPPGTAITAQTWVPAAAGPPLGSVAVVATGTVDTSGEATLTVDGSVLPQGPVNIRVSPSSPGLAPAPADDVVVQVVNTAGIVDGGQDYAPGGMVLQWDENFHDGLSVTQTGAGATYAATKPAYWGTSEFGDAVFIDPTSPDNAQNLAVVRNDYLRIRADGLGARTPNTPWGQRHASAILSSMRVGAGGFSAQYGYFEARILGAPGEGSWPAFWMMDTESATKRTLDGGEIDAVELYGHDPVGSCHSTHNWTLSDGSGEGSDCLTDNGFTDWTTTWHTYGVRILPGGAIYYIDGVEVSRSGGLRDHTPPYFFMINLALGGGWPVDLSSTGDITDMYVDWIRVYT